MFTNLLSRLRHPSEEETKRMRSFLDFAVPECEKAYNSTDPVLHFCAMLRPANVPFNGRNGLGRQLRRELESRGIVVSTVSAHIEVDSADDDDEDDWIERHVLEVWFKR